MYTALLKTSFLNLASPLLMTEGYCHRCIYTSEHVNCIYLHEYKILGECNAFVHKVSQNCA